MMKSIIDIDKWLFIKINKQGANYLFDQVMPFLREAMVWVPLYLFLVLFVVMNFARKGAVLIIYVAAITAAADILSSRFIKPFFARPRPCADPDFSPEVRFLANYCGTNGSFTSSHAVNHFAIAMFFFIVLKKVWGNWCYLFFLWAAAISYAQVYVGVHYPFDVLGGAIVGMTLGWIGASIFSRTTGELNYANK